MEPLEVLVVEDHAIVDELRGHLVEHVLPLHLEDLCLVLRDVITMRSWRRIVTLACLEVLQTPQARLHVPRHSLALRREDLGANPRRPGTWRFSWRAWRMLLRTIWRIARWRARWRAWGHCELVLLLCHDGARDRRLLRD